MSTLLAITASTNEVPLDGQRRGETSFTVFNASNRPLRARVTVTPASPALPAWFTIEGQSERDFPVSGTQQFTVDVAIPADVATGSYSFRLDAIDVGNPDEPAVQGPAVAFQVTNAPVPIATPKKGYLATLLGGIVGALAGLAIGALLGSIVSALIQGISGDAASLVQTVLLWVCTLVGAVLGVGVVLRSGNYANFAETAFILAGTGPVWVGLLLGLLLLIGSPRILADGGGPAVLLLCVSGALGVAVPPLAARAITLFWKTGHV